MNLDTIVDGNCDLLMGLINWPASSFPDYTEAARGRSSDWHGRVAGVPRRTPVFQRRAANRKAPTLDHPFHIPASSRARPTVRTNYTSPLTITASLRGNGS